MILLPLLGFVAGWLLRPAVEPAHSHDEQPRFMLLLYGGTDTPSDDGVREYGDWARRLAASGTEVSGEKLADDSELLVGAPLNNPVGRIFAASLSSRQLMSSARSSWRCHILTSSGAARSSCVGLIPPDGSPAATLSL